MSFETINKAYILKQPNTVYTMSWPNNLIFPEANYPLHKCAFRTLLSYVEVAFRADLNEKARKRLCTFSFLLLFLYSQSIPLNLSQGSKWIPACNRKYPVLKQAEKQEASWAHGGPSHSWLCVKFAVIVIYARQSYFHLLPTDIRNANIDMCSCL